MLHPWIFWNYYFLITPNADGSIMVRFQGCVGVCELSNVLLPTFNAIRAKTGMNNLVEGSEGSSERQPLHVNLRWDLAQLQLQAVHTLQELLVAFTSSFPPCLPQTVMFSCSSVNKKYKPLWTIMLKYFKKRIFRMLIK